MRGRCVLIFLGDVSSEGKPPLNEVWMSRRAFAVPSCALTRKSRVKSQHTPTLGFRNGSAAQGTCRQNVVWLDEAGWPWMLPSPRGAVHHPRCPPPPPPLPTKIVCWWRSTPGLSFHRAGCFALLDERPSPREAYGWGTIGSPGGGGVSRCTRGDLRRQSPNDFNRLLEVRLKAPRSLLPT